ncbi:MAG: RHS repeat-associated core domain-containing protein [Chitinophagaceae bacterium]
MKPSPAKDFPRLHYHPYGMVLPGRKYSAGSQYRYGFNGKENDKIITEGDVDFGARIYDGRIGRWLSVDPLQRKYPDIAPYQFCFNNPVLFIDPNGKEVIIKNQQGATVAIYKNDGTIIITRGMENSSELHSYQMARTYLSKASSSLQTIESSAYSGESEPPFRPK